MKKEYYHLYLNKKIKKTTKLTKPVEIAKIANVKPVTIEQAKTATKLSKPICKQKILLNNITQQQQYQTLLI